MSTIRDEVLKAVSNSKHALFVEEISHRMPGAKIGTIGSACHDLHVAGQIKAKRKNRPNQRIACVYYVRDEQLNDMEGLMDYEAQRTGPHKQKAAKLKEVMIAIPLGENRTEMVTIGQAKLILRQLSGLFGD
jgi:hypothetical protein